MKRRYRTPPIVGLFAILIGLLLAGVSLEAEAADCTVDPDARPWAVVGDATSDTDLSGAACAPNGQCLLVSDEKRRAWFFRMDEPIPGAPKIIVGERVKLKPAAGEDEADAEGAAFDNGHFYVIGSHGTSRYKNEFQASRFSAYRIKLDGSVQASGALARLLPGVPGIGEHLCAKEQAGSCESLQHGGANIEGLAARGGNLYVGFRAPSPGGNAFILRVAEEAVFGSAAPASQTFRVNLGQDDAGRDLGIRDISPVADGFLILAGPALPEGDNAVGSGKIFYWGENDTAPRLLRELTVKEKGIKPEVLLTLSETASSFRVLVMCDGGDGGSPAEYRIRRE